MVGWRSLEPLGRVAQILGMLLEDGQQPIRQILEQMEAVSHLDRLGHPAGGRLSIDASAVARNDPDGRMLLEPPGKGRGIPVVHHGNRLLSREVDDDCSIALTLQPHPVVDTDDLRRRQLGQWEPAKRRARTAHGCGSRPVGAA